MSINRTVMHTWICDNPSVPPIKAKTIKEARKKIAKDYKVKTINNLRKESA